MTIDIGTRYTIIKTSAMGQDRIPAVKVGETKLTFILMSDFGKRQKFLKTDGRKYGSNKGFGGVSIFAVQEKGY